MILASQAFQLQEQEAEEEMEVQEQQAKSRVVTVDSLESWDFRVNQATTQGTPVSIVVQSKASWISRFYLASFIWNKFIFSI